MATLPNFPTKISKHQKAFWLGISLGIFVLVGFVLSQSVLAQSDGLGLNEFGNETNLGTEVNLIGLIARIINIILGFLGVVAIGLILYAGWIWMTSRGDAQKIAKAKKIMAGGVIGLAIVLSAFAILSGNCWMLLVVMVVMAGVVGYQVIPNAALMLSGLIRKIIKLT